MTARANRFIQEGYVYHLTSRCHDRTFLLKSAVWRTEYRRRLREALSLFEVWLIGFCITSNHIHLLVTAASTDAVSEFMKKLQGEFGEWYNLRKSRHGAYWQDRYHCTMVQDGEHLWNCVVYIDLNMLRAGVVTHPAAWEWSSYREHVGERKRYRLVDRERLVALTHAGSMAAFERDYADAVADVLARGGLRREAKWTQSIAVGDKEYVLTIADMIRGRAKLKVTELGDGEWTVSDCCAPDALEGATLLADAGDGAASVIRPYEATLLGVFERTRGA